jgi:hypothetical protein
MKHYLLSLYQPEGELPPPEVLGRVMAELDLLNTQMRDAGAWVFGNGLHDPSTASVIRPSRPGGSPDGTGLGGGGKTGGSPDGRSNSSTGDDMTITDGPFLESKEYLGGFTIVRAADLDEALRWGTEFARITGLPVEVRPFQGDVD